MIRVNLSCLISLAVFCGIQLIYHIRVYIHFLKIALSLRLINNRLIPHAGFRIEKKIVARVKSIHSFFFLQFTRFMNNFQIDWAAVEISKN